MVEFSDKVACVGIGPAQILGAGELVVYSAGTILSVAKLALDKLAEAYHSYISKNQTRIWDVQIRIVADRKTLNGRVYAIFMAIITIIPFVGIIRYYQAKKQDDINILLNEANHAFYAGNTEEEKKKSVKVCYDKYQEAIAKGSAEAHYYLYSRASEFKNAGITITPQEELKLLSKAAEKGLYQAQDTLACVYDKDMDALFHIDGIAKDEKLALHWYKTGAMQGSSQCQLSYGKFLENKKDYLAANYWYKKASVHQYANFYYALNLFFGLGFPEATTDEAKQKNTDEALKMIRDLAKNKNKRAIVFLSQQDHVHYAINHLYFGNGIAEDKVTAENILILAANNDNKDAIDFCREHDIDIREEHDEIDHD